MIVRFLLWCLKILGHGKDPFLAGEPNDLQMAKARVKVYSEMIAQGTNPEKIIRDNDPFFGFFWNLQGHLNCIIDSDGHFLVVNREWYSALGFRPDEMAGKHFTNFIHEDDLQPTLDYFIGVSNGTIKLNYLENRYRHKDGTPVRLRWAPGTALTEYSWASATVVK